MKWIAWWFLGCTALAGAAEEPQSQPPKLKLHDAIEQVRHDTGGRILSAETVGHGRNQVYRIKVLTQAGVVRVVQVPTRKE